MIKLYNSYLQAVVKHSIPTTKRMGKLYADKLLGTIFSISNLPKKADGRDDYFDKASIQVICFHAL